ncbi:hypothetical protein AC579_8066 [Pseudocercospora musae]|uniref:Dickkopf N-terminal cysteine-rich domain-containing protein n=1 Tax=Pseudocercospora musae TaxID=113226 RepID=A0A139HSB5_9PEZI|nr:hypothetical protein AC579_8066 [Pseudocercospora musae]
MKQYSALSVTLWSLYAAATNTNAASTDSKCLAGPLAKPASQLKNYGPAQAYCSQQYPATTVTVTSCATPTSAPTRKERRKAQDDDKQSNDNDPEDRAKAFARIQQSPHAAQAAICSCISDPPSTISIIASCTPGQYCDESGDCKPKRNCNNPAQCESQSYCLEAAAGACFCHPDTDDSSRGYCMSGGPTAGGCPETYEDCASNAECQGARVCIYACCREQPFCVDINDYNPSTPNEAPANMLFSRERTGVNPT